MRVLGIDFGRARIGCAVSDDQLRLPSVLSTLIATGTLAKDAIQIVALAEKEKIDLVVLGLPLVGGEETKASQVFRRLGAEIETLGCKVAFVDESYTSAVAESVMIEAGLKGSERRKLSDGAAACAILERYFEQKDA